MTSLNFLLTRALARTLRADETVVCARLDHDANVAPWLALAEDLGIVVRFAGVHDDLSLDLDDLEAQLGGCAAWFALPVASRNTVGTTPDVPGSSSWPTMRHARVGRHGPVAATARSTPAGWDVDILLCSPYKFFGPHLGLAVGQRDLLERLRPYKVQPAADEAGRQAVRARHAAARAARGLRRGGQGGCLESATSWDAITAHERELGRRPSTAFHHREAVPSSHDGGPRAHVRLQPASAAAPRRSRSSWPPATSQIWHGSYADGCHEGASGSRAPAPSARASSTTTPPTRSTGF